jgi:hypothetical protein
MRVSQKRVARLKRGESAELDGLLTGCADEQVDQARRESDKG